MAGFDPFTNRNQPGLFRLCHLVLTCFSVQKLLFGRLSNCGNGTKWLNMTPERWAQIKRIFSAIVEDAPGNRQAALVALCNGDIELQVEVSELLTISETLDRTEKVAAPATSTLLEPREVLAGRYRIITFLGSGGMGEVYEAEDQELGGHVALKVIHPHVLLQKAGVERFRREVQLARQVTHANVCRIFDIEHHRADGRELTFLTLELVRGDDLGIRLKNEALAPGQALAIATQICYGLGAAHSAGILHRDLKPGNILLRTSDNHTEAIITDFSIARAIHDSEEKGALTGGHAVVGTPDYMSPEQFGGEELTVASDIYSLGLVLYEMVTGVKPFAGQSWMGRLTSEPPDPCKVVPGLDEKWSILIRRCLNRDPSQRFASTQEVIDFLRGFESATAKEIQLSGIPTDYWSKHSPFRSLRVFEPEDSWLFFGRDAEIQDLLNGLGREPVLAIVGNSGCGKSSLIRAGLIAALRSGSFQPGFAGESWRIAIFRPSESPFDYLAETLPGQLAPELGLKDQAEFIADCRRKLPLTEDALRNAISALANVAIDRSQGTRILLVADQFEELFTLTSSQEVRARYIDSLLAASRLDSAFPVHLVVALRADFYAHCLEHPALSRRLQSNLYNVPRMGPEQLRETIAKRLELASAHAEPGLMDSLLEDVGSEPGNLALLEHALGQLWQKWGGSGCTLTNRSYSDIGRLRGALGRYADEVYNSIGDEKQKWLARRVLLELVHLGEGAQDTRRRVKKRDLFSLGPSGQIEFLVARLTASRLISTGREERETFVEVSHEALIREWPRLREWLAENRDELKMERRLLRSAGEWEELNKDPELLLQGTRLAQAEEWLANCDNPPPLLKEFLQTSITTREDLLRKEREAQERELAREQARRREAEKLAEAEGQLRVQQIRSTVRLRWFSGVLVLLLLVAIGAAWFAHHQQVLAECRAMAAQSEQMLRTDQGRALDLAIRGWQLTKTNEGREAVTKAFPKILFTLPDDSRIYNLEFSPSADRIVAASGSGAAKIWSTSTGQLIAVLKGHNAGLLKAAFSPDGQRLVTGSDDHAAKVWSTDGRLLFTLNGHSAGVQHVSFSPDGRRIVTASLDHTARLWDFQGHSLQVLQGHNKLVLYATFSPDGNKIATASADRTVRIWNTQTGNALAVLQHDAPVQYAQFSRDGLYIVTAGDDHVAHIWNTANWQSLAILHHDGPVVHAEFSPDGQWVVTASNDKTARVWSIHGSREPVILQGHTGPIQMATFSSDGSYIVTASWDHTARVWDSMNGTLLATLQADGPIYDSRFSPDGRQIATAEESGVHIWNMAAGRLENVLQGHSDHIANARFSPDGRQVLTASLDGTARVWSTNGDLLFALRGHRNRVWAADFSPSGEQIVTAGDDDTARLWNSRTGDQLLVLRGHTGRLFAAAFALDGRRIVTAGEDSVARVWSTTDGHLVSELHGHNGAITCAAFAPDGERIVTAGADHTARIWNSTDGRQLSLLQAHTAGVLVALFSPDGHRIVTADEDGMARIWNSIDGRALSVLQGHTKQIFAAAFSPDNQHILTASQDGTARVWNSADGRLLMTLPHERGVTAAGYSPDGSRIVTASIDQTARVWNSTDGHLLAVLQGHSHTVSAASFSPDGRLVLTAGRDQTARIWQVMTLADIEKILTQ
jgi:WD40 repeat protein/serine/threonine protein kinase